MYRIVAKDTIEERMLKLQRDKSRLARQFTDGGASCGVGSLTKDDLLDLLSCHRRRRSAFGGTSRKRDGVSAGIAIMNGVMQGSPYNRVEIGVRPDPLNLMVNTSVGRHIFERYDVCNQQTI